MAEITIKVDVLDSKPVVDALHRAYRTLEENQKQFAMYAAMHRAKLTEEGKRKAEVNDNRARECADALRDIEAALRRGR